MALCRKVRVAAALQAGRMAAMLADGARFALQERLLRALALASPLARLYRLPSRTDA